MKLVRQLFYALLVRPVLLLCLGLSVRHLERLSLDKQKIIAANHNSHLDALVLMSLIRFSDIPKVKLVAAKDYFCRNPLQTWISLNLIGVIPIDRSGGDSDPLKPVLEGLAQGYSIVLFPEGSRGEPEQRQALKFGIVKLLEARPDLSVTPVFMHGLGKSLPRGEALFVPFVCEINVGEALPWTNDRVGFMSALEQTFTGLSVEMAPRPWS